MNRTRRNIGAALLALSLALPNLAGFTAPRGGAGALRRMEKLAGTEIETFCGMAEHTHSDECLEQQLVCTREETEGHTHTREAGCYAGEPKLLCTQAEHIHTKDCLKKTLTCTQEEDEGHTHTMENGCWQPEKTEKLCGIPEHSHSAEAGCYVDSPVLCCTEEHEHGEGCFTYERNLICQTPEHTHGAGCWHTEYTLVCKEEERAGHRHGAECYAVLEGAEYLCGYAQEHSHSRSCYEEINYLCGRSECAPHRHSADSGCYAPIEGSAYLCGLIEHKHTLACYANPQADTESREMWEKTLENAALCGVYAEDVLAIARTQLGYCESSENYMVNAGHKSGYTRYGAWYGMPYADWCAMFISFCLYYAGVPEAAFPKAAHCQLWIDALSSDAYKLYEARGEGEPCSGDLLFLDWDGDGEADHVGLICELISTEDGQIQGVKTIEGNYSDKVTENTHMLDEQALMGYGRLSCASCTPTAKICLGSDGLRLITDFAGADADALGGHSVELEKTGRNIRGDALISVAVETDYERWTFERADGGYRVYTEEGAARRYLSGGRMEGIKLVLMLSDEPEEAARFLCTESEGKYLLTAAET